MKNRVRQFEETAPGEFLTLRERLGLRRYRKSRKRSEEKKRVLLDIWLKKIEEKEKEDYLPLGTRRRFLKT